MKRHAFSFMEVGVKKVVLRSLVLSAAALPAFPFLAHAEEAKSNKSVTLNGAVETRFFLTDSQRKNALDLSVDTVRLGVKAKDGVAAGQLEIQAYGTGLVAVRRADLGLELPSKTSVKFGRHRVAGSNLYGSDNKIGADEWNVVDGLALNQDFDLGNGNGTSVTLHFGNELDQPDSAPVGATSATNKRAIIARVGANVSGAELAVAWGSQPQRITTTTTNNVAVKTAADTSKLGVSGAYNLGVATVGAWYNLTTEAGPKVATIGGGNTVETTGAAGKDRKTSVWGLGVQGDLASFGAKDLIAAGDKITYGVNYEVGGVRQGGTSESDYDIKHIGVHAGYVNGPLNLLLVYATDSAKAKIFNDNKGVAGKDSKNALYIKGAYGI